jgi:hypothetical protein
MVHTTTDDHGPVHCRAMASNAAAVSTMIAGHIGSRNRRNHHASNGV